MSIIIKFREDYSVNRTADKKKNIHQYCTIKTAILSHLAAEPFLHSIGKRQKFYFLFFVQHSNDMLSYKFSKMLPRLFMATANMQRVIVRSDNSKKSTIIINEASRQDYHTLAMWIRMLVKTGTMNNENLQSTLLFPLTTTKVKGRDSCEEFGRVVHELFTIDKRQLVL